jgi:glycosyltransferase involved in cell wall biosynthesis
MVKKILFLATVDSHIYYFHIPFMKLLRDMGYEVEVAASNVGFTEKIERDGFKVYNIPFSRNPISPSNFKAFFSLLRLMRKNKYVMLHTHTPVASFIGRIAGRIAGVPHIVYTAHGFHFHEYGNPLTNFIYFKLEKFAGKFTDVLVTINSDDYKVAVEKKMVPHGKVVYIKGVGVDTEKFDPKKYDSEVNEHYRKQFGFKDDDFVIIDIAEFTKGKNLSSLIEVFSRVLNYNYSPKLLIVGEGILFKEISDILESKELKDKIILPGRRSDIPEILCVSNLFAFTSIREGLPKSVMEAMAMEKPVVAYNIRGVRDLVEDGINGFLIPFGDTDAFAEKIIYLMEHPEFAKEMGKRGREKILKEFSLDVILPQMKELYESILKSPSN